MSRQQIDLQKAAAGKQGLYGHGSGLYRTSAFRHQGCNYASSTTNIYRNLGLPVGALQLTIHSTNARRTTPVLETVLQKFCAGQDIRFAWVEAAKTANCIDRDITDAVH